jgi:hypothetical protein
MRNIRDREAERADLLVFFPDPGVELGDVVGNGPHLVDQLGGVLSGFLERRYLL